MASVLAVPLMSTVDSSRYPRGHSHKRSYQSGRQRLPPPFGLPRIPSERLDPRSVSYHHDNPAHENGRKDKDGSWGHGSLASNGSVSAPALSINGQIKTITKREATLPSLDANSSLQPPGHRIHHHAHSQAVTERVSTMRTPSSYLRAILAGCLLPSPYILLSCLSVRRGDPFFTSIDIDASDSSTDKTLHNLFISLMLTSSTLLLLGAWGKCRSGRKQTSLTKTGLGKAADRSKAAPLRSSLSTISRVAQRVGGIALPNLAALQLGSLSMSYLLLVMVAAGLVPTNTDRFDLSRLQGWKRLFSQKPWTMAYSTLLCLAAAHYALLPWTSSFTGISAVVLSAFFCNPPPYLAQGAPHESYVPALLSARSTSPLPSTPWETSRSLSSVSTKTSVVISTAEETLLTLVSGAVAGAAAGLIYMFGFAATPTGSTAISFTMVSLLTISSLLLVEPAAFRETPIPLVTGLGTATLGNALIFSNFRNLWQDAILAAMACMTVQLDGAGSKAADPTHPHSTANEKHAKHAKRNISAPTKLLLRSTEGYTLLHGILADKDSRRIFYFMLLNLSFMLVQSTYGVLTGSLGLISDSIHMFFDCFALLVGLCAAVMSKWPPSVKYPYGYGKLDTLAGFGNGIFLMLISVEIVWEAIERLVEGSDVSRTMELLIVSSLGLGVNLVGIMAFEHGHGGHSHSHGDHSHSTTSHEHSHDSLSASSTHSSVGPKPPSHHHHHGGDNMYGIYLHIMADALGSVAVVISTLCVRYFEWSGFDPLASCAIAVLIFASAIPLVFSSGRKLLLSLPGDVEYTLRDVLAGVSTIRGVVGYTVPKFWLDDMGVKDSDHEHHRHGHNDHHHHTHDHAERSQSHEHPHSDHSHLEHQNNHHTHHGKCEDEKQAILGVIHVIASQHSDLNDVRGRVLDYLRSNNMDVVVQVERDGDVKCWCGGGQKTT